MATYADQYTMATAAPFIQRVEIAVATAALAVLAEAESTPDHSFRRSYAARVLSSPATEAANMAVGISTNPTIALAAPTGAAATDSDIQFTVNSMFNAYSLR